MFISTELTPNPNAMRFDAHRPLTSGASGAFEHGQNRTATSPLADALLALPGVKGVFIAPDFLTVSRDPNGPGWRDLRYPIIALLAEHLASCIALLAVGGGEAPTAPSAIEAEIRQVIDDYVGPGVARDGGEILFDRFDSETGVLWIRMRGACGGCPSAQLTLRAGVERIVRRYVPEVVRVEQAMSEPSGESAPSRMRRWLAPFGQSGERSPRTLFVHTGKTLQPTARQGEEPRA